MQRRRARWWLLARLVPFVAYFALLVYCDVLVPESEGLGFAFGESLVVRSVVAGSAASRAGLRPGDVIVAVDGRPISGRKMDWVAVANNVRFEVPLALDVLRQERHVRLALSLGRAPRARWTSREGIDLLVVRLVQLASIALGCLILMRRPDDRVARLGGWLLASVGVFCVVLPFRIAAIWRGLWWPLGAALWLPFVSSLLLGALLLSFFLLFPVRRVRSPLAMALLWLPMAAGAAPFLRYELAVVYAPSSLASLWDGLPLLLGTSAAYLAASGLAAAWSYRRLTDQTERRRLRVLLAGTLVGCIAGAPIIVGWWLTDSLMLFGSTAMGWLFPLLLSVPASFAYAILRHRLFDVRLIVRQGLRYALARRLLLSLVPALLLAMVADLYVHWDRPLREVLATHASVYVVLSATALVAQRERQRWLVALDRRFFRERYDAHRLLCRVVDDIRDAPDIERVAGPVVEQIELALHPRFAALLLKPAGADAFRPVAAAPPAAGPACIPGDAKLLAVARVLGRPMDVAPRTTGWVGEHLPAEETRLVTESGVELLVPIPARGDRAEALLVLGARRSEEPYAREDQELLRGIAATLGLLLARQPEAASPAGIFGECPSCGACVDAAAGSCIADGEPLVAVNLPRLLAERYRLDRRLGRGGMGTVYEACDTALRRTVAVKVLRDDLAGDREASERFEHEARAAAAFSHPHVVTIHDFGITARGRGFLVMERLQGRTLRTELEAFPHGLAPARVQRLLLGICAAVDAAHRRRLVHRDLKPENVFLAEVEGAEVAKVLDFGIAKALELVPGSRRETGLATVLGTPEYMAPEQLRGGHAGPAWDVWAVGVLSFEMLTGRHPFSAVVVGGAAPDVPAGRGALLGIGLAGFHPEWARFFSRVLAVDPASRPASAGALCDAFEQVLRSLPEVAS